MNFVNALIPFIGVGALGNHLYFLEMNLVKALIPLFGGECLREI